MSAQVGNLSADGVRKLRFGIVELAVLLVALLVAFGLGWTTRGITTSAPAVAIPTNVVNTAALDAHERHPLADAAVPAALDAHERHPLTIVSQDSPAALDAHERHPLADAAVPAALDAHERHP